MKTKYKSKIGVEIIIPLIIIFSVVIFLSKDGYSVWTVFALAPAILFIVYLFQNTYYTISYNILNIKSGFLLNTNIDINSITQISETNNMLSAPALSLDRLEIKYNTSRSIMISPSEKDRFIDQLKSINPTITIILKK